MKFGKKFELLLIAIFLLFSWWLMDKSFGYNSHTHQFRLARHEVGDFGLHLSLIRSFSWGHNFPPESPFYPGKSLPYHYYFDLTVGLLEKIGVRLDLAFNGPSLLGFTFLLYFIYQLSQTIFGQNKLLGLLSVLLFIFHSNLTFLDFFKNKPLSLSLVRDWWFLPDYLNKGPFDGSLISLFFTLNVFLNQRHLIIALALALGLLNFLLPRLLKNQKISVKSLIFIGLLLGLSSRIHTLTFFSTSLILFFVIFLFKRWRLLLFIFPPAFLVFLFHLRQILAQNLSHPLFNPGFLAARPLTLISFLQFWSVNLGLALFLIPLGFALANQKQKKIFLSFLPLFILGNLFQFGFRLDHNHSLFNFFLIIANFYVAFFLASLYQKRLWGKTLFVVFLFFLTISGIIDLSAIKNDFQLYFYDAPANQLMNWIKNNTSQKAVFLAKDELLDPITLSGRKNYLGARYYLEVMGYDFTEREKLIQSFFAANDTSSLDTMRNEGIQYLVLSQKKSASFGDQADLTFLKKNLKIVYQDNEFLVFQL